jgi:hypothetical protein
LNTNCDYNKYYYILIMSNSTGLLLKLGGGALASLGNHHTILMHDT